MRLRYRLLLQRRFLSYALPLRHLQSPGDTATTKTQVDDFCLLFYGEQNALGDVRVRRIVIARDDLDRNDACSVVDPRHPIPLFDVAAMTPATCVPCP